MTSAVVQGLVTDLAAEKEVLTTLLRGESETAWTRMTPAAGWTVHDQIAHLAQFDAIARRCIEEPTQFIAFRDGLEDLQTYVDGVGGRYSRRSAAEMLAWWDEENSRLCAAALAADPAIRVPWFGPAMSLASKLTARIMETWAHGQDIFDTLSVRREPSPRLRHVARIGVLAFPNSFRTRGLDVPDAPVSVVLDDPLGGDAWTWGEATAADRVSGPAEDFCLVVTQRRHIADTRLEVTGEVATQWMRIAQAFAGPAGAGRTPGQFAARA